MDHPGGSELDSSLPQPDNPCLIVEDSQPDSVVALMDQDDPESSYRALLSRRLSSLQPPTTSHSPVLELISSPAGSRSSQIDSQLERSQSCSQSGPAVAGPANVGPAHEEESQVISICPLPNKKSGAAEYSSMDSRADSTTHCAQSEEGTSQFGYLELSESQGLGGGEVEDVLGVKGDVMVPQTDSQRHSKPVEQRVGIDASGRRDNKSTRSEVTSSSSSSSSPLPQSVRAMRVQALLHSQGRHTTEDHQDSEVLSSQVDLFDAADKTGAGVDSTVSELHPTLTPAHTLGLLHLSGQGTLVQQSLSQCSTDYVAPTQDLLSQMPFIVPNSPTEGGPDEPMDTSLPTGSKAEGPMETAAVSKPRPTASTPVSQNSPGFVLEKTLSLPSQPDFSHDVFVATQSQEAASSSVVATRDAQRKPVTASSVRVEKPRSSVESSPSALSLRLTVNTETLLQASEQQQSQDDSQATQIEGLDEALGIDTSDSVTTMMSRCSSQRSERNNNNGGVSSSPKTTAAAAEPKAAVSASGLLKHSGEGAAGTEDRRAPPSQRSQVPESTPTAARNVTHVNVSQRAASGGGSPVGSQRADKVDALAGSRAQRTPPSTAVRGGGGGLTSMSQPVFSQTSSRASVNVTGSALNTQSLVKRGPSSSAPSQLLLSLDRDVMDEGLGDEAGEEEEEEGMMEEGESTLGPESSALGLALSQSQLLMSPEPMEEEMEGREEVSESERSHGLLEKGDVLLSPSQQRRSGSSQPAGSKVSVSTNGHGSSQAQSKEVRGAPNSLSQAERKGPEAKGVKDKSLSDSSGEIPFHFTLPKEGELIGPAVNATPPLINQLKQTPRHSSTPIDKPAAVCDASAATTVATCDMVTAESSGEDTAGKGNGKLSLRMKLVTPVEEGSSEHFCLQKPTLSDEEGSVVKVTAVTSSPSVFSRVRQVHRQLEVEEENQHDVTPSPVGRPSQGVPSSGANKGEGMRTSGKEDQGVSSSFMSLCSSFSSQRSSLGCNSLPGSQKDVPASQHREPSPKTPRREPSTSGSQAAAAAGGREVRGGSLGPTKTPTKTPGPQAKTPAGPQARPSPPTKTPGPQAAAAGVRSPEPPLTPTRTPGSQAAGVKSPEPPLTPTRTPGGPQAGDREVVRGSPEPSTPTRTPGPLATGVKSPEPSTPTRTPGPLATGVKSPEPSTPTRTPGGPQAGDREVRGSPEPSTPTRAADVGQRPESHQTSFENSNDTIILSPPSKRCAQKASSQPPGLDAQGFRSPSSRGEAETPSFRRTGSGPAHRRHVRTIQEVRTTVTRIITDVYYEDGKEVDRKVTEESEEPVVDCHVMDSNVSPCRTVSSLTSGDLADVSSLSSSKTSSSLQRSSSGTSTTGGHLRADFAMPSTSRGGSRGGRRGGGHQQRGHRGQRARSAVTKDRGFGSPPSSRGALVPQTGRGRARRGRPPSRSSPSRGGGTSGMRGVGTPGLPQSSSEDEPYTRLVSPPGLPDSPMDAQLPSQSDSLRSSPEEEEEEEGGSAGRSSSLVGLRVVAKWSSNHYFYSGRITRDMGERMFRLRFDDGYECEVLGKDILLCDPIPLETEVTALLEGEYFSIGTVKDHKTEDHELFYCVEREGNQQWHNRSTIILSLEQGNKLREQHSLGPYEPSTPLAKASDISLDNLVEGKRRRTGGTPGGQSTPNHSSNSSAAMSPRTTPGKPSGKRKLMSSEDNDGRRRTTTPAKRGRRGPGSRAAAAAAQRVGVVNTSDSAPEIPGQSTDLLPQTHGPLPQNTSLFMGFAFMLTASSECDRLSNKLTSDDDEEYVETAPYHRGYTESQLQAGGGFTLSDFNEEQCKAAYQSLLIADQHCRTSKYLQCVASGVPCVSHMWVRDCCKDNKLLNYRNYLLPAGVGPDHSIVEWHPRATPFKALRVLLVFEEPAELWSQLLTLSGASSVKHYQADKDAPDIPTGKFDLVITDRACPQSIQRSVMSQKLPLLSAEWLIQSLICGERQGYQKSQRLQSECLTATITCFDIYSPTRDTIESEEPVVDCHVMDSDVSPCRTVSSLTSGDLADVSSLSSSKTSSSLQRSSSGTRRGGGHQQRGHRGQRARSAVTKDRGFGSPPSSRGALVPQTGRGRARRGRPPSRSSPSRGGGTSGMRGVGTPGLPQSSSEDEPYTRLVSPPGLPDSPMDAQLPSQSDSLRSSPEEEEEEEGGSAGRSSSLVGLRVVAKWSSNHYFYSGRITRDMGERMFRLRFDDGYECEVLGKDILLCDPIPLETEVTALLEGEYFSIGTVKDHKTENHELFYCVEREGNQQWHNRSTIILSLEQGNKLREQHSLGPYEPSTPQAKASDISLDNLVEGKRRRTGGTPGGQSTPSHSSNSSAAMSPRTTPGKPSGKRKLMSSEDNDGRRRTTTPAKRGRRGPGSRAAAAAAQRVGVVNTSDSAPEIPGQSTDLLPQTHGPLPQNASLFMGFAFMLTASSECDRLSNKLTSDDDEEYVETAPYHRGYTESQLQAGGGFTLSDFNEEQCKAAYQSLLIADQHCRTSKYLQCVASGVPCVSHMWVRDCCKDNKLLNYRNYLLPAGVGPDHSIVEWHPRATPFKALRVLLVFEEPAELWSQLLTLSGASSVKHYQADKDAPDIPTGKFDLVITDRACPQSIQTSVMSQKLPLLSAEWLIQSLICGERQGYQSKPQYSHDHLS